MSEYSYPYISGTYNNDPGFGPFYGGAGLNNYQYNDGVIASSYNGFRLNNLDLTSVAGHMVLNPGKAILDGILYENTEPLTVNFANTVSNNRIDAVVLRKAVGSTSQTVRLTVIKGSVELPFPSNPAITASTDMLLYYVLIPHPYTSGVTYLDPKYIQDKREFIETPQSRDFLWTKRENLLINPEFVVSEFSLGAPTGWSAFGATGTVSRGNNSTGDSPRGFVFNFRQASTTPYYIQEVYAPKLLSRIPAVSPPLPSGEVFWIPVTVYLRVKLGNDQKLKVAVEAGSSVNYSEYWYNSTNGQWFDVVVRTYFSSKTLGTFKVRLYEANASAATNISVSFASLTFGNTPIKYEKKSELIWFEIEQAITGYNLNAFSTGNSVVTASILEGIGIGADVRALILSARIRDSGSSAAQARLSFHDKNGFGGNLGIVECSYAPNDSLVSQVVTVPIDNADGTDLFYLNYVASGAGTLDIGLYVIGVIT